MKFLYSSPALVLCVLAASHTAATAAIKFSTQPATNAVLLPGDSVTLHAEAIGTGITYQWFRDQAALDQATKKSLLVTLPGNYYCRANGASSTTSSVVSHLAPAVIPKKARLTLKGIYTESLFDIDGKLDFDAPPAVEVSYESDAFTFLTPTSFSDKEDGRFSATYTKSDAWTAELSFTQTFSSDGGLIAGINLLKFLSYDATSHTYYGTFTHTHSDSNSKTAGSGNFKLSVP